MTSQRGNHFQPMWKSIVVPAQSLAAFKDGEEVFSPNDALGDENRQLIKFNIPQFQRGLRWSEKRRKEFLQSMSEGLPVGTLVLGRQPQDANSEETRTWTVLDGQQRIATINNLLDTYWSKKRFGLSLEACNDWLTQLGLLFDAHFTESDAVEFARDSIEHALGATSDQRPESSILQDSSRFLRRVCQSAGVEYPVEDRLDDFLAVVTSIRTKVLGDYEQLRKYPVPVVLVSPNPVRTPSEQYKQLTEVFTALNNQQPLTTYEIVAAQWAPHNVEWPPANTSEPLSDWLYDRMQSRISSSYSENEDFDFDPNVAEFTIDTVTLYDFVYALGAMTDKTDIRRRQRGATDSSPRTVFSRPDEKLNETAFDVLALFLQGQKPPDFSRLPETFERGRLNKVVVHEVIEAYNDAANAVQDALKAFAPDGDKFVNRRPLFQLQAVAYLAAYVALTRNRDFSKRDRIEIPPDQSLSSRDAIRRFKKNLPAWWLLESIDGSFVGSNGNTNAVNRVWTRIDEDQRSPNRAMTEAPSLETVLNALANVFVEDSQQPSAPVQRARQSDLARAVMFATYVGEHFTQKVDIDHVVPFRSNREGQPRLPSPLPLNHVANFMPVEKTVNRSRQNNQWRDFITQVPGGQRTAMKNRLLIDSNLFSSDVLRSPITFLEVMLSRYLPMVDKILQNVDLKEYTQLDHEERIERLDGGLRSHIRDGLKLLYPEADVQSDFGMQGLSFIGE